MSSPFQVFRKNSGPLMVATCVMAMFAFVVADPLMSYMRGAANRGTSVGGLAPGDTAVEWRDGSLSNRELGNLVFQRRVTKGFLENLYRLGSQEAMTAGADPQLPPRVNLVAGVGRPERNIEREALQTKLFATEAKRLGMEVSDDNIRHYLTEVGRGRVSSDQMRSLLSHSQFGGGRIPIDFIFTALRDELLAQNFVSSYQYSLNSVLPQQRWEDWLRVNDRVVLEAAALPAEQFVVDVPDPTDTELVAFFEEYKANEPLPQIINNTELPSPNPGFATPQKVRVHFVKADYNAEISKLTDNVTDEEIAKYYEDNKEMFIRADSGFDDFEFDDDDEDSTDSATEETAAESSVESTEESAEETMEEDDSSTETTTEAEESTEATSAEAAEEEEEEEEAGAEAAAEKSEESANEAASESTDEAATEEAAGDDDATMETESDEASTEKPAEYQPLEEVQDDIRLAIAEQRVAELLAEKMNKLYGELKSAHTSWEAKVFDAEDEGKEPPAPPEVLSNLESLATANELESQKTGQLSRIQLRDTPLGSSRNPDRFGQAPLWLVMFSELELYEPTLTYDLDGNRYLSLKVEDHPENIPELDEVRSEVVRAWKLRQAADLALKRAEELAKEAQEDGSPLADKFVDNDRIEVTKTNPFSWLTIGNISPTTRQVFFRMSEPEGVVAAGPDFMQAAFKLDNGQVGAVLNHDRSIAYVVRMAEHSLGDESLRQQFLAEADRWYGLPSMSNFHNQQAAQALVGNLIESTGVDWKRLPDVPPDDES